MQHWRITGNSNVTIQTGSTYFSDSITDVASYNFDGKPEVFDHGEIAESVNKWL